MNKIVRHLAIVVWVALAAGCAATTDIETKEGACYLKASDHDVYLKVFDVDSNGNMGALIWQGRIHQSQTARIKTTHARFRFFYNAEPGVEQPFRSGEDKRCDDLDVVAVP